MNWESLATEGVIQKPQINLFYGPNGVGKTTLSCAFGNGMIADLEDGSANIAGVKRFPKASFDPSKEEENAKTTGFMKLKSFLTWVLTANHGKETLILDSLESMEDLTNAHTAIQAGADSVEDIPYGKGPPRSREHIRDIMHMLQMIRDRKQMTVNIVAHSQIKAHTDPTTNQTYDRVIIRANDKFAAVVRDLSDNVLFIKPKVYTTEIKGKKGKLAAHSANERVILTQWSAGFDAKTRVNLPSEIDFTLDNIHDVVATLKGQDSAIVLREIEDLMPMIQDHAKVEAARKRITDANGDVTVLRVVRDRLKDLAGEKA